MKRLHVGVRNLERSVQFCSALFGAAPTVAKHDYAKWMLDVSRGRARHIRQLLRMTP